MNELFAEDLLSLLTDKPRLLSDIIASLRGSMRCGIERPESKRVWRNLREQEVTEILLDLGAYFGDTPHASGVATYVASAPFSEVQVNRPYNKPKFVPVRRVRSTRSAFGRY